MLVIIKSAPERHVFVGTSKLSEKHWASHELTPDILKSIKNGDILEATDKDLAPPASESKTPGVEEVPRSRK